MDEGGEGGGWDGIKVGVHDGRLQTMEKVGDEARWEGAEEVAKARPDAEAQEQVKLITRCERPTRRQEEGTPAS